MSNLEYRIRRGGRCDYSGQESATLVQLVDQSGNPTGWIGSAALQEASSLLAAMQGLTPQHFEPKMVPASAPVQYVQPQVSQAAPQPQAQPAPQQAPQPQGGLTQTELVALRQFRSECERLKANPPPNHKGEVNGVGDKDIREIMDKYKAFFSNPLQAMKPTLQEMFGIPEPRLEFFLS
jgi:hypothetical protein